MRKEERIFVYGQIFALTKKGFNISQIALETGLSRPTVYKYLAMSLEELESWCNNLSVRRKKLDPCRNKIQVLGETRKGRFIDLGRIGLYPLRKSWHSIAL